MHKPSLIAASIFGSTAVIIGAFAAHALKKVLPVDALQTIETAVRYQMYHAIVLLMLCLSNTWISAKSIKRIYRLLLSGILCFSGSIYLLIYVNLIGNIIANFDSFFLYQIFSRYFELKIFMII